MKKAVFTQASSGKSQKTGAGETSGFSGGKPILQQSGSLLQQQSLQLQRAPTQIIKQGEDGVFRMMDKTSSASSLENDGGSIIFPISQASSEVVACNSVCPENHENTLFINNMIFAASSHATCDDRDGNYPEDEADMPGSAGDLLLVGLVDRQSMSDSGTAP